MKGILILNVNEKFNGQQKLFEVISPLFGEVFIHANAKVNIQKKIELDDCSYSNIIIDVNTTTHVDYVSKNAKIIASHNGVLDFNDLSVFAEHSFIEKQKDFDPNKNFIKNLKENYLMTFNGNFSLALNYLSNNTRPFIALMNRCANPNEASNIPIDILIIHDKTCSFLLWGYDLYTDYQFLLAQLPNAEIEQVHILAEHNSLIVIQPLHLLWKFNKWRSIDKLFNTKISVPKLVNYLSKPKV